MPEPRDEPSDLPDGFVIRGEYYHGAFGPTIILVIPTPEAAGWLMSRFTDMATEGAEDTLSGYHEVAIQGISTLNLRRVDQGEDVRLDVLERRGLPEFTLSATADGWKYLAGLVEPFVAGVRGHQYLTRHGVDPAVIEVSFGERLP